MVTISAKYPLRNKAQQAAVEARLADDVAYYNYIKQAEAKKAHLDNKVEDAAPQVSVAT